VRVFPARSRRRAGATGILKSFFYLLDLAAMARCPTLSKGFRLRVMDRIECSPEARTA
jgi:hypothetical protein